MLEPLMPFITVLPFGAAMLVATIGYAPAIAIIFRGPKSTPATMQVVACAGGLVGAWAVLNAVTPLLTA